jgi:hypothetical protein
MENMQITVDVNMDELQGAIKQAVKSAICNQLAGYGTGQFIKDAVTKQFCQSVQDIVTQELQQTEKIRGKVVEEIEKKIRNKLTKLMQESTKE